jgi:hypothetical protein
MKSCTKNRHLIAYLALDALDDRKAAALRDHLASCESCRLYWGEISNVAEKLAAAKPDSDLQPSESFHHGVAEKLQAVQSRRVLEDLSAWFRSSMLNWRAAMPATAVLLAAFCALLAPRHPPAPSVPTPPPAQAASPARPETDLAPTVANYQIIASQSLEKLDELLTRQGNKSLPPAPSYTVLSFGPATTSF